MWRPAMYRLMALSFSGRPYRKADGTLPYLLTLAADATNARGRQWIDRTDRPAVLETSAAYRISRYVLTEADENTLHHEVLADALGVSVAELQEQTRPAPAPAATRLRGFALMTPEQRQRNASRAGRRAHALGVAHRFTPEEAATAARKRTGRRRKPFSPRS